MRVIVGDVFYCVESGNIRMAKAELGVHEIAAAVAFRSSIDEEVSAVPGVGGGLSNLAALEKMSTRNDISGLFVPGMAGDYGAVSWTGLWRWSRGLFGIYVVRDFDSSTVRV